MTEMLTYTTFRDMTVSDLGNTLKSDNLSKRRIHDAEITTNMQII